MKVERIDLLKDHSMAAFANELLNKSPFIIQHRLLHWPAIRSWTTEYLTRHYGSAPVTVTLFDPHSRSTFLDQTLDDVHKTMCLSDYLGTLEDSDSRYALREDTSLFAQFPSLLRELSYFSPFCSRELVSALNYKSLWLGPANYVTGLHSDPGDTLLFQIRGRKEVVLFGPDETRFLYEEEPAELSRKFRGGTLKSRLNPSAFAILQHGVKWSRVTPFVRNLEEFPLFARAQSIEGCLDPGDALYIPDRWWHSLRSAEPTISVSIEPLQLSNHSCGS